VVVGDAVEHAGQLAGRGMQVEHAVVLLRGGFLGKVDRAGPADSSAYR
jgi:hypothetical protein